MSDTRQLRTRLEDAQVRLKALEGSLSTPLDKAGVEADYLAWRQSIIERRIMVLDRSRALLDQAHELREAEESLEVQAAATEVSLARLGPSPVIFTGSMLFGGIAGTLAALKGLSLIGGSTGALVVIGGAFVCLAYLVRRAAKVTTRAERVR